MTVYVVTKGNYSDYHIIGVRLTREDAEKLVNLFKSDYKYDCPEIEEYDTEDYEELFYGLKQYYIMLDKSGGIVSCHEDSVPNEYFSEKVYDINSSSSLTYYGAKVYATDEDHAKKIAKDRLMKYLAEKEGL